jgi:hypothetical protein
MKKIKKFLFVILLLFATFIILCFILVLTSKDANTVMKEQADKVVEWKSLTSEKKQKALEDMIANKDFENESEVKQSLKEAVNKEFNSEAVFHVDPSPYNTFSNVVEPDSGWISVNFNGTYRNYGNDKINFSGSAILVYHPDNKTLSVKNWNVDNSKTD